MGVVQRSRRSVVFGAMMLAAFVALLALGTWQVARRSWKLDLIARTDRRIQAPPVSPPGPAGWPAMNRDHDEYRRVRVLGTFLIAQDTFVQASTVLGPGFWVLTPMRTAEGFVVLVNRGFVPPEQRGRVGAVADDPTSVTGLLRMTEPKGGFLRRNDPAHGRWYSRDVAAIAAADGLSDVAPYFIDADSTPNPGGWPVGGLTVIAFPNNHLVYAITWYSLAAMLAGTAFHLVRAGRSRPDG